MHFPAAFERCSWRWIDSEQIGGLYAQRLEAIPPTSTEVPAIIQEKHQLADDDFTSFLSLGESSSTSALARLRKKHASEYKAAWKTVESKDSRLMSPAQRSSLAHLKRTIDWQKIFEILKEIEASGKDYSETEKGLTRFKVAEAQWQVQAKQHGFPGRWNDLVRKAFIEGIETHSTPSSSRTMQPSVSENDGSVVMEDHMMEDSTGTTHSVLDDSDISMRSGSRISTRSNEANVSNDLGSLPDATSITVRDGNQSREVLGFRKCGMGYQLFLKMTSADVAFAGYEMVASRRWRGVLEQLKAQGGFDLKEWKGDKTSLKDKDFDDVEWIGIITTPGTSPAGRLATDCADLHYMSLEGRGW